MFDTVKQPLSELETLRQENERLKIVHSYVVGLDMQHEMLDFLIAEDAWESWAELHVALLELRGESL